HSAQSSFFREFLWPRVDTDGGILDALPLGDVCAAYLRGVRTAVAAPLFFKEEAMELRLATRKFLRLGLSSLTALALAVSAVQAQVVIPYPGCPTPTPAVTVPSQSQPQPQPTQPQPQPLQPQAQPQPQQPQPQQFAAVDPYGGSGLAAGPGDTSAQQS